MVLNPNKCSFIRFSGNKCPIMSYYHISGNLNVIDSVRDLGVILDSKLRFEEHVDTVVKASLQKSNKKSTPLQQFNS